MVRWMHKGRSFSSSTFAAVKWTLKNLTSPRAKNINRSKIIRSHKKSWKNYHGKKLLRSSIIIQSYYKIFLDLKYSSLPLSFVGLSLFSALRISPCSRLSFFLELSCHSRPSDSFTALVPKLPPNTSTIRHRVSRHRMEPPLHSTAAAMCHRTSSLYMLLPSQSAARPPIPKSVAANRDLKPQSRAAAAANSRWKPLLQAAAVVSRRRKHFTGVATTRHRRPLPQATTLCVSSRCKPPSAVVTASYRPPVP